MSHPPRSLMCVPSILTTRDRDVHPKCAKGPLASPQTRNSPLCALPFELSFDTNYSTACSPPPAFGT